MEVASLRLIFIFSFVILIPCLLANIADFDEVWRRRTEEALIAAEEAYDPKPEVAVSNFNMEVHKFSDGNPTRRNLGFSDGNSVGRNFRRKPRKRVRKRPYRGPCNATNAIDQCWRCQQDWAENRQKLADCVLGFGHKTTGGKQGRIYVVTDHSDLDLQNPKPGTLRFGVIQKEPLWIIFAHDMHIKLSQELIIASDKTIDGRGADVHLAYGAGITLQFVKNVIIHGVHIHHIIPGSGGTIRDSVDHIGTRTSSDGDGISIFGSTNIWLDHLSMSRCKDGLIDVIQGSTAITISNSHFTRHNSVILLGASDSFYGDKLMQVTIAFNHFGQRLIQRMPRCRLGFFHVVNNDYTHWQMYAIGGSKNPTIISQGNRFIAPNNPAAKAVTNRNYAVYDEWKHWIWRSEGDLFMNGAFFNESGDPRNTMKVNPDDLIKAKPGTEVTWLTRFTGALYCHKGQKC